MISPLSVQRRPANRRRRALASAGSEGLVAAAKRSSTAVDTLLTFCPPGPEARVKTSVTSQSCKDTVSVMRNMGLL